MIIVRTKCSEETWLDKGIAGKREERCAFHTTRKQLSSPLYCWGHSDRQDMTRWYVVGPGL